MKKILNKEELINEIVKMERGVAYILNILDKDKELEWCTLVTKTRWFDSHVVVIGGADDDLIISNNFGSNDEGIRDMIKDLVASLYGEWYILKDKSRLNIKSDTPSLGSGCATDNFEYSRNMRK